VPCLLVYVRNQPIGEPKFANIVASGIVDLIALGKLARLLPFVREQRIA
jgi:hypothetical protein